MKIGIVVLTYNKQTPEFSKPFQEVLNSMQSQKFSGHIDVLFIDNLSGPAFIENIHKFCSENSKDGAIDEFQDPSVGIISVLSEFDSTIRLDNGKYAFPRLLEPGDTPLVLSIDEIVHLHVGFFSSYYLKEYNYRYQDVMLSFGPGSLPGFFCRGIGKTWTLTRSSVLANGSFRYPPLKEKKKKKLAIAGFSGFLIDPSVNKTFEQLMLPGKSVGLGFQNWQRVAKLKGLEGMGGFWMDYDPSFYDESGKHKNPDILKKYLKDNMFILDPDYEGRLKNSIQYLNMD